MNTSDPDSRLRKVGRDRATCRVITCRRWSTSATLALGVETVVNLPDLGQLLADDERDLSRSSNGPVSSTQRRSLLLDAGDRTMSRWDSLAAGGIEALILLDAGKRKGARPGWQGGRYEWMRRVLATELGERLYRQRSQTVEPMFGHTKHNRGMSRFHRRGRSAARTEWRLITATHNLTKLHSHTLAAATA